MPLMIFGSLLVISGFYVALRKRGRIRILSRPFVGFGLIMLLFGYISQPGLAMGASASASGKVVAPHVVLIGVVCTILLAVIIFRLVEWWSAKRNYEATSYFEITHNPFSGLKNDTGKYGEYLTFLELQHWEEQGARFLFNVFLPTANDETTEVDMMMIAKQGIFVFECKEYSGWIFGSEKYRMWTQTLPSGRESIKHSFFNPIWQNRGHIAALRELLSEDVPMRSIVVFSDNCELKNVSYDISEVDVVNRSGLSAVMNSLVASNPVVYSQNAIEQCYSALYPLTQVDQAVREAHIARIAQKQQQLQYQMHYGPKRRPQVAAQQVRYPSREAAGAGYANSASPAPVSQVNNEDLIETCETQYSSTKQHSRTVNSKSEYKPRH